MEPRQPPCMSLTRIDAAADSAQPRRMACMMGSQSLICIAVSQPPFICHRIQSTETQTDESFTPNLSERYTISWNISTVRVTPIKKCFIVKFSFFEIHRRRVP